MLVDTSEAPMRNRFFSGLNFLKSLFYIMYSSVLLFPVLSSPLVADDFAAPFYQFQNVGFGLTPAVKYGWNNAYGGVNFRILGMPFGSVFHFLYVDLAGRFGIKISTTYFLVKLLVFLGVGVSASWVCRELLRLAGKHLSHWSVLFVTSTILFVSLQNHGLWSNDPVTGYPLAGFGSVILGLAILGFSLRITRRGITGLRLALLTLLTTSSVLYYELNVGIIVGIFPLLLISMLRSDATSSSSLGFKIRKTLWVSVPCAVPALALLWGRILSGSSTQAYGGTTIRLGSQALHTFLRGMISTLPGSAWALSSERLGGSISVLYGVFPIVVIGVAVVIGCLYLESHRITESENSDNWLAIAGLGSLVFFWTIGVGIQSVTTKVQDESPRLGYVYTYYAIGATVVALLISVALLYFGAALRVKTLTVACGLLLTVVGSVQLTVNWRLMDNMYASLEPNRELLVAFSSQTDVPHRCRALLDWSNGPWPDYYEDGMIAGLQSANRHYHDEDFCPNFERPRP